jgi:aminopeptidase N
MASMAGNLTRDEAKRRARLLTVHSYELELDFTGAHELFTSTTTVTFSCAEPGAVTFIDLAAEQVTAASLNGQPLTGGSNPEGRLVLPPLARKNELTVAARCRYSATKEGLHKFTDPTDGKTYLYSNFEPADAHQVYACFDQPDLKATFKLTVIVPPDWRVISNSTPEAASGDGRWHFPATPPLAPYVTFIAAGPYHEIRDGSGDVPVSIYCRTGLASDVDSAEIFTTIRQGLGFYQKQLGDYPFDKCDFIFVPEFYGAMENAAAVTIAEDYIFRSRVTDAARAERAEIILHELAHMWFGNLVTMRWWDDLWLKESFATFASALCQAEATRWVNAWTTFTQFWKSFAYRQDQLPTTHPVAADICDLCAVETNFDGITYAKGASVLRQLAAYVGQDSFSAGTRTYFAEHAWSNASLADLLSALEAASGRDLAAWSREWLHTAGLNTLRPVYTVDEDDNFTSFGVIQEAPDSHPVLRSHRITIGLYDQAGDRLRRRDHVTVDIADLYTAVPALAGRARPDLVLVNDDDLAYAKVRLDDRSLRTLFGVAGAFTESLPAALCWAMAWDMCQDGELTARDYLRLVVSGVARVADMSVVQTLLSQAAIAVRRYAGPGWRQQGLAELADGLYGLLRETRPGSDSQLAYIQTFAKVAVTGEQLELTRALLDGQVRFPGLAVDTDLRWSLLYRLVATGRASAAEVHAELSRDGTDAGQRHAARCLAAIPDSEAKHATWSGIVAARSAGLPGATFKAILDGFNDPDQYAITAPYAESYFRLAAHLWRNAGHEMAAAFATLAYPSAISEQTIARTDAYLATPGVPAGLRRLLTEASHDVSRALRAQARALDDADIAEILTSGAGR